MHRPNYTRLAIFAIPCLAILGGVLLLGDGDGGDGSLGGALIAGLLAAVAFVLVVWKVIPWIRDERTDER